MNTPKAPARSRRRRALARLLVPCTLLASSFGQTAPAAPAGGAATEDGAIQLGLFEVSATRDRGYASFSTLSGTRTNEELKNLPNAISILNRELLEDIAVSDFFEVAPYLVGFEPQEGGAATIGGNSGAGFMVRGIPNNWQSRNGFQWYVPNDSFNAERLESNRGPSGQLYGDIGAGGILNIATKQANFTDRTQLQFRFDDWGQRRASTDINRKLTDRLAARLNLVASESGSWRDGPSNNIVGAALATTWRPGRNTEVRLEAEIGEINNNTTHNMLTDNYSDWTPGTGTNAADVDPSTPGVQQQFSTIAPHPITGLPTTYTTTSTLQGQGNNQRWTLVNGRLFSLESSGPATGATSRIYRATTVDTNRRVNAPESLSPREHSWSGPMQRADRDYHVISAFLAHRFNPNFTVELGYNMQWQLNETNLTGVGSVARDPNPFIPVPGAPSTGAEIANPYYNELYVEHQYVQSATRNTVHNGRLLAVYDWKTPWMTQRLVGLGTLRYELVAADSYIEVMSRPYLESLGLTGAALTGGGNRLTRRFYLKDGRDDRQLYPVHLPGLVRFKDPSTFNARSLNRLYTGALNSFGSYWDGRIRSSIGVRRDLWDRNQRTATPDPVTNEVDFPGPLLGIQELWNTSVNYGGVVFVRPWLAAVYNYSETFIANTAGNNFDGTLLDPQFGSGYDVGVRFSLFDDRVNLNVTYFDNRNENTRINNILGGNANAQQLVLDEITALLGPVNTETGAAWTRNGSDLQTRASTGYEFELTANPTPNLTARAALTITEAGNDDRADRLKYHFSRMVEAARAQNLPESAYVNTSVRLQNLAEEDPPVVWRPTATARYRFSDGRLRGLAIGGTFFWNDFVRIPATFNPSTVVAGQVVRGDMTRPGFKVPAYWTGNVFFTYTKRFSNRTTWTTQLNINNLTDNTPRLGGYTSGRFPNPRQFIFTNTFTF